MSIEAKVIADSTSPAGKRLTTLQLKFHRYLLPEFNTHRVFSRNFSSSRAIPVAKLIEQVRTDPAMPVHWGKNQPGMQAKEELTGDALTEAQAEWGRAAKWAADSAEVMNALGAHKQLVNRVLEPYLYVSGIVTATEFDNFFELRAHEDAQPEIHELALCMDEAMRRSEPKLLQLGEWHLPYVDFDALETINADVRGTWDAVMEVARKVSAARCCRVSYLRHDGHPSTIEEDLALCDRLVGARPLHASPFEHIATPMEDPTIWSGNFQGWRQYRKLIEHQFR